MYLIDLRAGKAPVYSLDRYALYICYFPQAISGPLARGAEVMDQFGQQIFRPGWERRCAMGTALIVIGLLQKVLLADPIGAAIDPIYAQALHGPVADGKSWAALAFAFQVFFDFSGYSDVAIGVALILGVTLPQNFDAPFRTTSIVVFWQRWHMTLARFLRDYVFTRLSRWKIIGGKDRMLRAYRHHPDHGAVRVVAWRRLDVRGVGHAARHRHRLRDALGPGICGRRPPSSDGRRR